MTSGEPEASAPNSNTDAAVMRERRIQRNLKILVAGLGVLIVALLGAVVVKMITGMGSSRTFGPSGGSVTSLATPVGEIALEIPKGARVVSVSLSGNRLAVHHEGPAGTGIAIIDIETGRRVADVKPLEAVPRN